MNTRARITTWQRLRQQPTWKLLAADSAPLIAARSGFLANQWLAPRTRPAAPARTRPCLAGLLGGLGDIHAPFDELAALTLPASHVFIVENKQTGLAFDDLPGALVLMARGYAVDRLHALPWVQGADAVHYWGDIDTHGLAILGRLRGHLPQVRSLLMDEGTLLAYRDLWVDEPQPHRSDRADGLDDAEQALYHDLRGDRWGVRVRLEQERIGWDVAWTRIRQLCA